MMHWRSSLYKTTAKCGNGLLYWKDAGFGSRRRYGDGRCRFIPASLPPASFPVDGFHWQIWIIPGWISEQCFREHDHQQLPDVRQLLVYYLQGLLLRIVYCGPALRAPPPPPFATHLYCFNGILEMVFFIRLSMALLIRLIMALFTRPEIGLFHPTLTSDKKVEKILKKIPLGLDRKYGDNAELYRSVEEQMKVFKRYQETGTTVFEEEIDLINVFHNMGFQLQLH